MRCAYRPFDNRWLYWEPESGLLARPRPECRTNVFAENLWLSAAQHVRKGAAEPQAYVTGLIGQLHLIERSANLFPIRLRGHDIESDSGNSGNVARANLTATTRRYLRRLGADVEDLFHYVLAVLHDPDYRCVNAGALCFGWPHIPLPDWPDGDAQGAAGAFAEVAARGRHLVTLFDPDTPVPGVTQGSLRDEFAMIAVPTTVDGHHMTGDDFAVTVGWGRRGDGDAVMPGQGRAVERSFTTEERGRLGDDLAPLGDTTVDVYLNSTAFWRNVLVAVWNYKLGGYQVLKKWLSYRERQVLGRAPSAEEVRFSADLVRRILAILSATR